MADRGHVFLAGATGAIGKPLLGMLVAAGYAVTGTTRRAERVADIERAGAKAVVLDVLDRAATAAALAAARPDVVIHQLTDLPPGLDPARMGDALERNARLRRDGTHNLVDAALGNGARHMIAQSIAWAYAPGRAPHVEDDPLDTGAAPGPRLTTVEGVVALERAVLASPPLAGTVLRYGNLYGPGTGRDTAGGAAPLHVDDAAAAAMLALERGTIGIFNIAEPNGTMSCAKAARELAWSPRSGRPH